MPRTRGPVRATNWFDDTLTGTQVTGGATSGLLLLNDVPADSQKEGLTIVRQIIDIAVCVAAEQPGFGTSNIQLAMGIISSEASAAGVLPDLNDDADYPLRGYMWKSYGTLVYTSGAILQQVLHFHADSRSMRKLESDSELLLFHNNSLRNGLGTTVAIGGLVRTLVKLP